MNKKTVKKALLLIACAILLVVASVMGTLAYLTDSKTVTNTFTSGKVAITLDEAKVDLYGVVQGDTRIQDTNSYILIPGREYTKDPVVRVDPASENSFIFVTINNGIEAYESKEAGYISILKQITDKTDGYGWAAVPNVDGVYYKNYVKGQADKDLEVFDGFTVDKMLNNADLPNSEVTVVVTAYAIQEDGFVDNPKGAWDALQLQIAHDNP